MSFVEFANVVKFSRGAGNYHDNPVLNYKMLVFWGIFFGGFLIRVHFLKKIKNSKKTHWFNYNV